MWLIVLENKAYDASLTGLNDDSYLSQTLPSQGALLTNYYGTGHSSLDNYLSLFSGQAPVTDDQDDCPAYDLLDGTVDMSGSLATNPNFGQFVSAAGPDAPAGDNGCVYPSSVPTVFNQLAANDETWKLYAQDLGNPDPAGAATHDAGTQYCGAADPSPGAIAGDRRRRQRDRIPEPLERRRDRPVRRQAQPAAVVRVDPRVRATAPLDCSPTASTPTISRRCSAAMTRCTRICRAYRTTPDLSVIVPNNCSNGHDAVCAGNNLSGGFGGSNGQVPNSPVNYTGGLYAENLFLEHIIPEIEQSPGVQGGRPDPDRLG